MRAEASIDSKLQKMTEGSLVRKFWVDGSKKRMWTPLLRISSTIIEASTTINITSEKVSTSSCLNLFHLSCIILE